MVSRAAHLSENFIQPLQGAVQVHFYPTRGGGHVLETNQINFDTNKLSNINLSFFKVKCKCATFN